MPDSDNKSLPGHMIAGGYKKPLIIITTGLSLFVCFHVWISSRIDLIGYTESVFYLQDYAYHIILTNHFWFKNNGNIYDSGFQLQALSTYMGRPALAIMPVGVTPIALIVWMPFAYIANFSLSLAYSLWIASSIGLMALSLWIICVYLSPLKSQHALPLTLCGITAFSIVGAATIVVGQTSFFAGGVFVLILYRIICVGHGQKKIPVDRFVIILVSLVSIKPPYMVIGFGILLIYGRWREFFCSAAIVLLLAAFLTPMLSAGWLPSYLNTLHMYSSGNFPDIYDWSIVPGTMNILRSAISGLTGDSVATLGSRIISGLIFLSIGVLSLCRPWSYNIRGPKLVVALIACCLLFVPYSGAYEDMLLIPVFVIVMVTGQTRPVSSFKSIAVVAALFICLLHNILPLHHHHLWIFFGLKFMVLTSMIGYAGNKKVFDGMGRRQKND